jgi:dihydropteroate synthase
MVASTGQLRAGNRVLDLTQPVVMGVLNITPDSFSDGGDFYRHHNVDVNLVVDRAEQMLAEGAQILDVGGESSRPGADPVPDAEELARVMPVLERLLELDTIVSLDTYKPNIAAQAIAVGCHLINDISGARSGKMLELVAQSSTALCLMHMQGAPQTMQAQPSYQDVRAEVGQFLLQQLQRAKAVGIEQDRLLADPGFGFGKSVAHNLALLRGLPGLQEQLAQAGLSVPILVGLSRKSMLAALTQRAVEERLAGSVACATLAVFGGAKVVRAHDVAATVDAIAVAQAVRNG